LQQTGPLLGPEPYKHPKITKLIRNTPWMKYNKKTINIAYAIVIEHHFAHQFPDLMQQHLGH
jgi:hypothetical protein